MLTGTMTTLAPLALCLLAFTAADPALAANCAKNPNHPSCPDGGSGGDGSGNEKVPSTLVFDDTFPGITSDGNGAYIDNTSAGGNHEVFIGSQAKEGDLLMRLMAPNTRTVTLDFSGGEPPAESSDCLPNAAIVLRHLEVNVSEGDGTPQGVYNLGGDSVDVSMKILFNGTVDGEEGLWFLNFGTGERKLCGNNVHANHGVTVTETAADVWTVTNDLSQGTTACLERHGSGQVKTKFCGEYAMPFHFTFCAGTNAPCPPAP